MAIVGICFVVLMFIGLPVAFVMGISSMVYLLINDLSLSIMPIRLFSSSNSWPLMAVPLFMMAGSIMNECGITKKLVDFSRLLVGWMKGGVAQVIIVTCMFFAAITGSAVTAASAIGGMLAPALEEEGYNKDFSAAVIASSAVVGPIIPPSVPMIILAVSTNVSAGKLLMAGLIPGVLMSLSMMVLVYVMASMGIIGEGERKPFDASKILPGMRDAVVPLGMPLIILIGIGFGIFTATEAAAVAVLYALIIGLFVYKNLDWNIFKVIIKDTIMSSATLLLIMAMAAPFAWVLTVEEITETIKVLILNFSSSPYVFLIIINIVLLILGCFMETASVIILVSPILMPIAIQYGIDPVHFGTVMVVNLLIGSLTPPLGVCLFIAASITERRIDQVMRYLWPFILVLIAILLLITYVPAITLFLPNMLF